MKQEAMVLLATDFSEPARRAYGYAATLARALKGEVVILNVLQLPMELDLEYPVNLLYLKQLQEEPAAELGRWVQRAEKDGLQAMPKQMLGEPASCIAEGARKVGAALIVMGTHGRTGVSRLLLGSTAEKVMREAPCPVLTVGLVKATDQPAESPKPESIERLIVPIDFSDTAQAALEFAVALAKKLGARIRLVHALEGATFSMMRTSEEKALQAAERARLQEIASAVKADGVTTETVCEVGLAADLIMAQAEVTPDRLIVMGTHGRGWVGRLALGSVADHIVRHALCPVVTVKSPKYHTAAASEQRKESADAKQEA